MTEQESQTINSTIQRASRRRGSHTPQVAQAQEPSAVADPPSPPAPETVEPGAASPGTAEVPPVASSPTPKEPVVPALQPFPDSTKGLYAGDVVQITSQEGRSFGMFLVVGDVQHGKVHGYVIMEGGKRDYVTVDESACHPIGKAKVRSRQTCSHKWMADHS